MICSIGLTYYLLVHHVNCIILFVRRAEQQFGNFQNGEEMQQLKNDRSDFGRFYYRFPEGESGLDVYNRSTSFIGTMFRDWSRNDPDVQKEMTVIVVTHGLTLRLFLMRWYQYTVREVCRFCPSICCALVSDLFH